MRPTCCGDIPHIHAISIFKCLEEDPCETEEADLEKLCQKVYHLLWLQHLESTGPYPGNDGRI